MPQEFLHLFDRLTLVNQKAACRMPQIMENKLLFLMQFSTYETNDRFRYREE